MKPSILIALATMGLACSHQGDTSTATTASSAGECPEFGTPAWYDHIEVTLGVSDGSHGPDQGSDEWNQAVDAALSHEDDGHGPDVGSQEWLSAVNHQVCGE